VSLRPFVRLWLRWSVDTLGTMFSDATGAGEDSTSPGGGFGRRSRPTGGEDFTARRAAGDDEPTGGGAPAGTQQVSVGPVQLRRNPSTTSVVGTNLKVRGGHTCGVKRQNFLFVVVPLHFLALQVQSVVLEIAFVMNSPVWSVYCLMFVYSWCSSCPAIRKSGGRAIVLYGVGANGCTTATRNLNFAGCEKKTITPRFVLQFSNGNRMEF